MSRYSWTPTDESEGAQVACFASACDCASPGANAERDDLPNLARELRDTAARRGWERVSPSEAAWARASASSLTETLKEPVLLVVEDDIYRVRETQAALPFQITRNNNETSRSERRHCWSQPIATKSITGGSDDRIAILPTEIGRTPPIPPYGITLPILNVSQFPYRQLTRMSIPKINGNNSGASGAFVGPRHVLTAGHALVGWSGGPIKVQAGASGDVSTATFNTTAGFIYNPTIIPIGNIPPLVEKGKDIALLVLPNSKSAASIGWFGLDEVGPPTFGEVFGGEPPLTVRVYGYPARNYWCPTTKTIPSINGFRPNYPWCGTSNNRHLYVDTCGASVLVGFNIIEYDCDTQPGMSGGPLFKAPGPSQKVVGVHRGAWGASNDATRLRWDYEIAAICFMTAITPSSFVIYNCLSGLPALPASSSFI